MLINSNLYSNPAVNFFQRSISHPLSNRHRIILVIATVALGLLAAAYLLKRSLYERVFHHTKKEEQAVKHEPQEPKKPIEQQKNGPEDPTPQTPEGDKQAEKPLENPLIDKMEDLKKHTLELEEEEKQLRLQLIEGKTKEKNNYQMMIKGDQERLALYKNKIKEIKNHKLELEKRQSILTQEISDRKAEVEKAKKEIEELYLEIDRLSQGNAEHLHHEVVFNPDDDIQTPSGKTVKARDYLGTQSHVLNIADHFLLMSEENGLKYINDNYHRNSQLPQYVALMRGIQFNCDRRDSHPPHDYHFTTVWNGDGVIPCIKIYYIIPNTIVNAEAINLKKGLLGLLDFNLEQLTKLLNKNLDDKKELEDKLNNLARSLNSSVDTKNKTKEQLTKDLERLKKLEEELP